MGVKIVVFSTHRIPIRERLQSHEYPAVDLYLDSSMLGGKKKGSKAWVARAESELGIPHHDMLYVGDDEQDWREAINTGTFPLHAKWAKPEHEKQPLAVADPKELYKVTVHGPSVTAVQAASRQG
jgi:hypothetical protein